MYFVHFKNYVVHIKCLDRIVLALKISFDASLV